MTRSMTWIFYAKCDDDELTSTYVAWYKISVSGNFDTHYCLVGGANITDNNISFPLHYYSNAIRIMRKNIYAVFYVINTGQSK